MKKYFPLLWILICALLFGCTPRTEYDDKTVAEIRTELYGGMVDIDVHYVRTFDFVNDTVTDERIATQADLDLLIERYRNDLPNHPDWESVEEYCANLDNTFNNPKTAGTFTAEQADALLKEIKKRGVYTWDDRYYEQAEDAGTTVIIITFSDGTQKRTECTAQYPDNYEPIARAFNEYLDIGLLLGIDYNV